MLFAHSKINLLSYRALQSMTMQERWRYLIHFFNPFDHSSRGWTEWPPLKIGRYFHTSCALRGTNLVFVFCGKIRPSAQPISSIEKLDASNLSAGW